MQELFQQTQERLQARRDTLQSSTEPDRPVVDGDVTTMAVKFERWVIVLNMLSLNESKNTNRPQTNN